MSGFKEWFEASKPEILEKVQRNDIEDLLYIAYHKGVQDGIDILTPAKEPTPETWEDRMGGQFTAEEIEQSRRGGHGW